MSIYKGQLYLMFSVLVICSALPLLEVQIYGNEDIWEDAILILCSFIILYLAFVGNPFFKWVGVVAFAILSLAASGTPRDSRLCCLKRYG